MLRSLLQVVILLFLLAGIVASHTVVLAETGINSLSGKINVVEPNSSYDNNSPLDNLDFVPLTSQVVDASIFCTLQGFNRQSVSESTAAGRSHIRAPPYFNL